MRADLAGSHSVLLRTMARIGGRARRSQGRVQDGRAPDDAVVEARAAPGGRREQVSSRRQRPQQCVARGALRDLRAHGLLALAERAHDEIADPRRAQGAHALREKGVVARKPAVAARPQQVGAGRDRSEAEGDAVRVVLGVHPGRERDRHLRPRAPVPVDQRHRDHVQWAAGEVHDLLRGGKERTVVAHHERVRELHLERAAARACHLGQPVRDLERLVPLQVLVEVLRARPHLVVPEDVVQEAVHRLPAEQGRVELDRHVHVHLREQETDDAFDLPRGAAVKGRQGDLVGELGGEVEVAPAPQVVGDLAPQGLDLGAGVLHRVDPGPHLGRADAGQVVAHAHVEDGVLLEPVGGQPEQVVRLEHVEEHRARHVLAQTVGQPQLLAPFDVVADRGGVDARPGQDQAVVDLDGLELEDAAPGQPGQHDVLRHLVLGAGRGSDRARRAPSVEEHGGVEVRRAVPELARGQVEDLPLTLVLAGHPAQEGAEGRADQLRHQWTGAEW